MIRITREADYGIVLMSLLANHVGEDFSASQLAERRGLPLPVVSKILKVLARAGLLSSRRGVQGGYRLARSADDISLADIVAALDGPIALTDCSPGHSHDCAYQEQCALTPHWYRINQVVMQALQGVSLREMSQPPVAPAYAVVDTHRLSLRTSS
ncbi:BadM/Rrf2 family transcriptional regulator [Plasticicumulans lactativorans]|uniref:BadM/Rrf2 family transcriptional regulator n=1 Tax=Plasticicumulans lactativorans TaxID=1133106 RepID=A0A4R2L1F7_9GAMM|nr:SUF system Fe-S cluster assembly regulator [Plasticicumulans lactativorans]TCO76388.1 BadM/Rrf2 family transcriptional regulator [Plasticicumulans lactativorans]